VMCALTASEHFD
jgi:hypothetical protein